MAHHAAVAGEIPFDDVWTTPFGGAPRGPGEGVLVDHQPYNSGGPLADTEGFESVGGQPIWQFLADDFAFPNGGSIRRIVFWGFYNYGIEPAGDELFEIEFHHPRNSDGLPGDVYYAATFLNPSREWTGRNVISAGGGREYRFVVDLAVPLAVLPDETKWLSIHQLGDPSTAFRWEFSLSGDLNGEAYRNPAFPDWRLTALSPNPNAAFMLLSVPEPSAAVLVIVGCLSGVLFRRRASRSGV